MKTYGLTLDEQQLDIIGHALGEVPYRIAAPVIQAIDVQIRTALAPPLGAAPGAGTAVEGKAGVVATDVAQP